MEGVWPPLSSTRVCDGECPGPSDATSRNASRGSHSTQGCAPCVQHPSPSSGQKGLPLSVSVLEFGDTLHLEDSEWPLEMGMRVPFGMRVAVLDAWRGRLAKQPGKRLGQATPAFSATAPSRTQPGRPRRVTGQPAGPRHSGHCSARQRFKLWGRTTSWTSPQRTVWSGGICRTFAKTESRRRTAAASVRVRVCVCGGCQQGRLAGDLCGERIGPGGTGVCAETPGPVTGTTSSAAGSVRSGYQAGRAACAVKGQFL